MTTPQKITILGSTGSIGVYTLDVLAKHADRFSVFALTANGNIDLLFTQCRQFRPRYAALAEGAQANDLQQRLKQAGISTQVLAGKSALIELATAAETDIVMAAIVGAAGLHPTLLAAQAGKRILLANKEALIMAAPLFIQAVKNNGAVIIPVDSEHNAIFQCLPAQFNCGVDQARVEKIILTASGGPFRQYPLDKLKQVTPEQAVKHPNWAMGKKISVDSATMMNKGFEVIEAHWLFGVELAKIEVLIHPQSIIHSMVAYQDGSILAQMGSPDMRTPIACALSWPNRIASGVKLLDFLSLERLEFQALDLARYPCLDLAYSAIKTGGSAPIVLNAANEVAVELFLSHRLGFTQIAELISEALDQIEPVKITSLDDIIGVDAKARELSYQLGASISFADA